MEDFLSNVKIPKHIAGLLDEQPLTMSEVSRITGFCETSIRNWIDNGHLDAYKLGKKTGEDDSGNESIRTYGSCLKDLYRKTKILPKQYRELKAAAQKD